VVDDDDELELPAAAAPAEDDVSPRPGDNEDGQNDQKRNTSKFTFSWARVGSHAAHAHGELHVAGVGTTPRSGSASDHRRQTPARVGRSPRLASAPQTPGFDPSSGSDASITGLKPGSTFVTASPRLATTTSETAGEQPNDGGPPVCRYAATQESVFGGSNFSKPLNQQVMIGRGPAFPESPGLELNSPHGTHSSSNRLVAQKDDANQPAVPQPQPQPQPEQCPTPHPATDATALAPTDATSPLSPSSRLRANPSQERSVFIAGDMLGSRNSSQTGTRSGGLVQSAHGLVQQYHFAVTMLTREGYQRRRELVMNFVKPTIMTRMRNWIDASDTGESSLGPLSNPQNVSATVAKERKRDGLQVQFRPPLSYSEMMFEVDPTTHPDILASYRTSLNAASYRRTSLSVEDLRTAPRVVTTERLAAHHPAMAIKRVVTTRPEPQPTD
jgi:hypothetical protein